MKTQNIDGHTFYPELINDGWIIDAGCRGFAFMNQLYDKKVYGLDIEKLEFPNNNLEYQRFNVAALMPYTGRTFAYFFGNGTGNFVKGVNEEPQNDEERECDRKWVSAITLEDIYKEIGEDIGLLKLDIEGAEYEVLAKMQRAVPRQISVEFHDHVHPRLHERHFEKVLKNLDQWYLLEEFKDPQWPQYMMDCLFVRKDQILT